MALVTETYAVSGLAYEASAETIKKRLCALNGVRSAAVLLKDKTVRVSYEDSLLNPRDIVREIEACGYQAWLPQKETEVLPLMPKKQKRDRTVWILSLLSIGIVLSGILIPFAFIGIILMTIGLAVGFIDEEDDSMRHRINDERILVSTSVLLASVFAIIQAVHNALTWPFALSALMILLVHHIANRILSDAKASARAMFETVSLPAHANLSTEHTESIIASSDLQKDDVIILRPGEVSPADGIVTRGFAHVNEAVLSGLSTPVEKTIGATVYAGTVLLDGNLSVRIEEVGSTTAMMKFTAAAEKSAEGHSRASALTSTGHSLLFYLWAAAAAAFTAWYLQSQNFFLAAMCSLSILACGALHAFSYISLSSVNHTALKARNKRILFRSVEAMRDLSDTDAVYMEQDGIITSSSFTVDEMTPLNGTDTAHLGYAAYALLSDNAKPAARAILNYLRTSSLSRRDISTLSRYSKQGRLTYRKDENSFCGSIAQCKEAGIDLSSCQNLIDTAHREGKRILFFAENRKLIGYAILHKPLLDHIKERLEDLQKENIELYLFVNGTDGEAEYFKRTLPFDGVYTHTGREEKKKILSEASASHDCAVYLSEEGANGFENTADYCVLAHARAALDRTDCDVLYASDDLNDFKQAMDLSSHMRTVMEQKQAFIILYHIAMILLCGIVIPLSVHFALPAYISVLGALFCLWIASRA